MIDLSLPRADVKIVQSFKDLSGTSSPFSLPYGFCYVDFDAADPNAGTTVSVLDGGGNTLVTVYPNIHGLVGGPAGGAQFFVGVGGGAGLTVQVANGTASPVVIPG